MRRSTCVLKISSVFAGIGLTSFAYAAAFQINELSPTIQATGLSDAATAWGDISGMAFNPATLGTIQNPDIYAASSIIIPNVGYQNATSTLPTDNPGTVTAQNNISPTALVPSLYAGLPLPNELHNIKVGLGVDAPFGLETNYDSNWVGQFNALESKVEVINVFPTIAYQITPNLDVGASVEFERIAATYSNNTNFFGYPTGTSTLTGNAWSTGFSVGALYKAPTNTTLGVDYHSQVSEDIDGNANTVLGNLPASVNIKLPATVNLGISQEITPKFTLMAGALWTQWDSVPSIDVNLASLSIADINLADDSILNYSNAWLFSLGGSYQLTPKLKAMAGMAYDETPTNNQYRDARIPDTNRQWLTIGLNYAATQHLNVFGTYEHIFMNDQSINSTEPGTSINGISLGPSQVAADYQGYANIVAAGVNYVF